MNKHSVFRVCGLVVASLALLMTCACSALFPAATPQPTFYSLDGPRSTAPPPAPKGAPTLIINPPRAAAGFDSPRIIYLREPHKLEYFAHSEWVDTPARMLVPLMVAALENTAVFGAVVRTPSAATGDMRLETEIVRLQHEFGPGPSRVQFTLRAALVDEKTRRVLARHEFNAAAPTPSQDPYGGVMAANRAVQTVLESLATFCAETARSARLP